MAPHKDKGMSLCRKILMLKIVMCNIDWSALGQWVGAGISGFFAYQMWKIEANRSAREQYLKVYADAIKKFESIKSDNANVSESVQIAIDIAKRHKEPLVAILYAYQDWEKNNGRASSVQMLLLRLASSDYSRRWPTPKQWSDSHSE